MVVVIEVLGSAGPKVSHGKGVLRLADERDRCLAHQGTRNSDVKPKGCRDSRSGCTIDFQGKEIYRQPGKDRRRYDGD